MRRTLAALASVAILGLTSAMAYASPITIPSGTYTLNAAAPGGTITGTITVSGTTVTPNNVIFNDAAAGDPVFTTGGSIGQNNGYADVTLNASNGQLVLYFSSITNGDINLLLCTGDCSTANTNDSYIHLYNNYNNYQSADLTGGTLVAPTPEPSSLVLFGSGLVGIAGLVRRRFRKA